MTHGIGGQRAPLARWLIFGPSFILTPCRPFADGSLGLSTASKRKHDPPRPVALPDILFPGHEWGFHVDPATGAKESDVLDEVVAVGTAGRLPPPGVDARLGVRAPSDSETVLAAAVVPAVDDSPQWDEESD